MTLSLNGLCSCFTKDRTCGYHFDEFLREQGFSHDEAWLTLLFELHEERARGFLYPDLECRHETPH